MTEHNAYDAANRLPFPVVGLGASAGGLQALIRCFENMPGAPDMAFVVILHLSPKHESNAAEILQRVTRMPVRQVKAATRIERDHVYVIPPTHSLSMHDGHLSLAKPERDKGRHVAIDVFFRTLADAHRERAIGVVLSGTGSDGVLGVARLKEQGGVVIAQSPDDAEHSGMPEHAIATGRVDFVLPVADIPQKLIELWTNARQIELPIDEPGGPDVLPPSSPEAAEQALRDILARLQTQTGNDFKHYKRGTVLRRVERRLQVNGLRTLPAYLEFLESHPNEAPALLSDMLIGVTNFFRDRDAFEALERDVLPQLFDAPAGGEQLRAWVPGCSTGEEAYSLAMLLGDARSRARQAREIQVFASDIDDTALATAREGKYPQAIVTDVPPKFLRDCFTTTSSGYQVNELVRKRVLFAEHNLLRDPPFSRLDLVSCRNLLIYLDREVQKDILQMFHFALRPGGFLFLGSSETSDAAGAFFEPVDRKHRIYRTTVGLRAVRNMPSFPLGGDVRPVLLPKPGSAPADPPAPASVGDIHRAVAFEDDSTGTLLASEDLDILHTSPAASQFLRFAEGDPSRKLLTVIRPELRPELRLAVFQATKSNATVTTSALRLDGDARPVRMTVRTARRPDWPGELILVRFTREDESSSSLPPSSGDPALAQLEQALQRKDEQLQATIQQFSATTEDLKSSNEELQALNEELRSATEELETSKEELQSTNEELLSVNVELKSKVEETSRVHDDWQNLLRASEIATVFIDPQMRIKRFTPAAATIFNLIDTDVDRPLLDITHKLDYAALAEDAAATFTTLRMAEKELRSTDGRWFLTRFTPYRSSEDRIAGAVLTFVDISSRVLAESKMHLGEEQMRLVMSSLPEFAMLTADDEGIIATWSRGAQSVFGYSAEEAIGQPIAMIYTPEDRDAGVPEQEMRLATEHGRAPDKRWHLRKDGSRIYVSGVLTRLSMGKLRGFGKIAHDVTALQRGHEEESAAVSAARAAAAMKDEFLAVMSHELKHPLNLIHVNTELLLHLPETRSLPAVRKAGEKIARGVATQARIIDDLLDLSRTKAGKLRLERAPLDLTAALQASLQWTLSQTQEKGLEVAYEPPGDPIYVNADPIRIEQVMMNLLGNAVKFTAPGGKIVIRLFETPEHAVLEIADDGRGIDADFLPHVFDMFEQEERGTSRREGGMGIGLGLARELVELHGGTIEAASPGAGLGATFTVRLPRHERTEFSVLDQTVPTHELLAGSRILVIDDDADALETFAMLLKIEGAEVTLAHSGADALHICNSERFDLVISDIGMPKMDGNELIARLRRLPGFQRVPAIALTGYGRPQDVQAALKAGFMAHASKPVDIDKLRSLAVGLMQRE